jgi:hypothetical protein
MRRNFSMRARSKDLPSSRDSSLLKGRPVDFNHAMYPRGVPWFLGFRGLMSIYAVKTGGGSCATRESLVSRGIGPN